MKVIAMLNDDAEWRCTGGDKDQSRGSASSHDLFCTYTLCPIFFLASHTTSALKPHRSFDNLSAMKISTAATP